MNDRNNVSNTKEKLDLACLYIVSKKFEQARQICEQILLAAPDNPEAITWLAAAWYGLGNLDQVEAFCHRALELEPRLATPYIKLGQVYWRRQDYGQARHYLQQALQLSPDNASAYATLGVIESEQQHFIIAEHYLTQATTLAPAESWIHFARGWVLENNQKYRQALLAYRQGVNLEKNFDTIWQYGLAVGRIYGIFPILRLLSPWLLLVFVLPLVAAIPIAIVIVSFFIGADPLPLSEWRT